jgi:hypothetical protein
MEKILLAIDAYNPDKNAIEFACYLGRLTKSKITGTFLENVTAGQKVVLQNGSETVNEDQDADDYWIQNLARIERIEKNIRFFRQKCAAEEVLCRVHRDRGFPATELIEESRFADLIVIDSGFSMNTHSEGSPTDFVNDILKNAECPVVLAPENFNGINEIIIAYNGSASSVFALKQFTYLFPELGDKKITAVQVNETGRWEEEGKHNFSEWLRIHYKNVHFEALKGDTERALFDYLVKRKGVLLVMGAYGRNALSQFLKHSRAELLIKNLTQPIFITHK